MTDKISLVATTAIADMMVKLDTKEAKATLDIAAERAKIFAPWHAAGLTLDHFDAVKAKATKDNFRKAAFEMIDGLAWMSVVVEDAKGKAKRLSVADLQEIQKATQADGKIKISSDRLFQGIRFRALAKAAMAKAKAEDPNFKVANWAGWQSARRATIKTQYTNFLQANKLVVVDKITKTEIEKMVTPLKTILSKTTKAGFKINGDVTILQAAINTALEQITMAPPKVTTTTRTRKPKAN